MVVVADYVYIFIYHKLPVIQMQPMLTLVDYLVARRVIGEVLSCETIEVTSLVLTGRHKCANDERVIIY